MVVSVVKSRTALGEDEVQGKRPMTDHFILKTAPLERDEETS